MRHSLPPPAPSLHIVANSPPEERHQVQLVGGIRHSSYVGIVDEFHVNLATAPARENAGAFHSRKERYSYNVLGVTDDTKRFRYLDYGYPASSSNMCVQRAAEPLKHPDTQFVIN